MSLFRTEVLTARSRKLHGDVILMQPVSFKVITGVFFLLTSAAVFFAGSQEYTRKETTVGYISPETGLTTIRASQGGTFTQIFVKEGDIVQAGAPIFESRIDIETKDGFVSERRLASTEIRLGELRSSQEETRKRYTEEQERLTVLIKSIESELEALESRKILETEVAKLATKRHEKFKRLRAEEVVTPPEYDAAQAQEFQALISLENLSQQITNRESSLLETKFSLQGLSGRRRTDLSGITQQIASLKEGRASLQAQTSYIVRSPVAGRVSALQAEVGEVAQSGALVAAIIPENAKLQATLLVPSFAAGFVDEGQDVNLLLDPFPYQKFGVQKGRIREISDTPFNPGEFRSPVRYETAVYRVQVELDKETITAYGNEVPLKAGMTLQGDVVTDRRSLIEWMFEPLLTLRRN